MSEDKKTLSMLLVGGSGEGKSEFILSFINDEHRKRIPASGDGQTTRTSMVYTINREKTPLKITMTIKPKEVFCGDRVEAFMSKFSMENIKDKHLMRALKNAFIHNNAFFDVNEFSKENRDTIDKKYDELFNSDFFEAIEETPVENDRNLKCKVSQDWLSRLNRNDESKTEYTLEDCLELFSEWTYGICLDEIRKYLEHKQILLEKKDNIPIDISILADESDSLRTFIRTEEGKNSYSSLVETICISTCIADYYLDLFDDLRISKCKFVDTYGLDHNKVPEKDVLINRYERLFSEYPEIDTVLYIRKARSNPPSDLDQNIPPLYKVKPSVMSYIIFTNVDIAEDSGKKTIKGMRNPENPVYDSIYDELKKNKVDVNLSEMRIKCIAENIVEYCSKTKGVYNRDAYESYIHEHPEQIEQLKKLLLSIRDKRHLGSQLINIENIAADSMMREILNVDKIFSKHEVFSGYPGRTIGALANNLQKGELRFQSSTWDRFKYWDDEIFSHVKNRFFNISNELNWTEILGSENAVPVIQSLFNEFMEMCVRCRRDYSRRLTDLPREEYCSSCDHKGKCLQSIIYEQKKQLISVKTLPVSQWLTEIYNFSTFDDVVKKIIQQIFFDLYNDRFIPFCRENNARILASEINTEMTEQEIERKIQDYYDNYDKGLDEDGRILFEQMVNQYVEWAEI